MVFDYDSFIESLKEREERFRQRAPRVSLKDLGSQETNPYGLVYPEHRVIFEEAPQHCTYYRIEPAKAVQYCGHIRTVMVFLMPFDNVGDFIDYFGASPQIVGHYILHGLILPLIGNPDLYKKPKVKEVYSPLFEILWRAGEQYWPVYANRMEDCISMIGKIVTTKNQKAEFGK